MSGPARPAIKSCSAMGGARPTFRGTARPEARPEPKSVRQHGTISTLLCSHLIPVMASCNNCITSTNRKVFELDTSMQDPFPLVAVMEARFSHC